VHRRNSSYAYVLFYNRSQADRTSGSGGFSEQDAGSTASEGRVPLIRRQSVNRPDLWPHTQVRDSQFREFSRFSKRRLLPLPLPPLEAAASAASKDDSSDDGMEPDDVYDGGATATANGNGAVLVVSSDADMMDVSEGNQPQQQQQQRRKSTSMPSRFL